MSEFDEILMGNLSCNQNKIVLRSKEHIKKTFLQNDEY